MKLRYTRGKCICFCIKKKCHGYVCKGRTNSEDVFENILLCSNFSSCKFQLRNSSSLYSLLFGLQMCIKEDRTFAIFCCNCSSLYKITALVNRVKLNLLFSCGRIQKYIDTKQAVEQFLNLAFVLR